MREVPRLIRSMIVVGVLALVASTPAFAQGVAIVVDRVGPVSVEDATPRTMVTTLSRWAPGTRLRLGDAASLRLLFVESGDEFAVAGPGVVIVGPSAATADEGAKLTQNRAAPVGNRLRVRTDSLALGGVVMRGAGVSARSPRGVLTHMPTSLAWDDLVVDGAYIVRIRTQDGPILFEQRVSGLGMPFPRVQLVPDTRYVWSVAADATDNRKAATASASFELAAPSLRAEASELEAHASASYVDRVEFALWLESIGASSEAMQLWQRLADARPDDEAIRARAHR